jgi:hypothetical protein
VVRLFDEPGPLARSTGERAADVAVQLALDEVLGQCPDVYGDERSLRTARLEVDRAGDQLLPRPALADQEHRAIRRRDLRDQPEDALHLRAGADDVLELGVSVRRAHRTAATANRAG